MTSSFEQSFKKKFQLVAKERNITPAQVWQNVVHERFLVRLCQSPYRENFILKGGVLLAKHIDIGRETKDLDFSVRSIQSGITHLGNVINSIVSIDLRDGFTFNNIKVEPLDHFHMEYAGARIKMNACLHTVRLPLFIDLGFGDFVRVKEEAFALLSCAKDALFEKKIRLQCYPLEFVFAEKFETIVFRAGENSRMKDYQDLYTLTKQQGLLSREETYNAIKAVFAHRHTPLHVPLCFEHSVLESLQNFWKRYQETNTPNKKLPLQIHQIIEAINEWLFQSNNGGVAQSQSRAEPSVIEASSPPA